ncbi:MAG: DUF4830 domain-containing protein [Clostridia bacterium]|nr:DUF4830 domain-containing protein [Clostridia bacterium]
MTAAIYKNRYILATLTFALVLFIIILGVFSIDNSTNRMIVDYVGNLGWVINPSPAEISHLTIPDEFDMVYETYNAVQKKSGFDLTEFKGKKVTRYTYQVQNHVESDKSDVYLGILVYEKRIIAGDISSTDMNGFLHGINEVSKIKNN